MRSDIDSRINGAEVVRAMVPMAEMFGYATALRNMSQGRANFTLQFLNYQMVTEEVIRQMINEDFVAGGGGFPMHPHRDMEIITYVREGAITHKDNMGNEGRTEAGDVQIMSAGTGVNAPRPIAKT